MLVSFTIILILFFAIGLNSAANFGVVVNSASEYPFAVRIILKYKHIKTKVDNLYGCGGVIFSPSIVLTAAHCLYHKDEKVTAIKVTAGKTNYGAASSMEQEVMVKGYRIHKDYQFKIGHLFGANEYRVNDVAIVWLKELFRVTSTVKQATFAANSFQNDIKGKALGFGPVSKKTSAKQLYEVPLQAISYHKCRNVRKHYNGPNTFCALSVDNQSCRNTKGDSGSAFVYDNKVIGLVSFGSADDKGNVCEDMPTVMTDITKHAETIAKYLKEGPPQQTCSKPQEKFCALQ